MKLEIEDCIVWGSSPGFVTNVDEDGNVSLNLEKRFVAWISKDFVKFIRKVG